MNRSQNKQQQLIEELTTDLEKDRSRLLSIPSLMVIWFVSCFLLTAAVMHWLQPFRENFISQIFSYPLFTLETMSGLIGIILLTISVFVSSIPGLSNYFRWSAYAITLIWISIIFSGFFQHVLPVSMLGKRDLCFIEVILFGMPITVLMTFIVYRRYSLTPVTSAILISFSSMLLPAYLMQYACMYEAQHNVMFHLMPAIIMALILTPLIAMILQRRIK